MTSTTFTPANQPFLKYLNVQKTPYVFLTAETDDFDTVTVQEWHDEGFVVNYVPLGDGGAEYTKRLHRFADEVVGISEQYAIVGKLLPKMKRKRRNSPSLLDRQKSSACHV